MKEMREKILERLNTFMEEHGGIYRVAKKIDRSPQFFYSMFKRGTMPAADLLSLFMEHFEDFDLMWIMTGKRSVGKGADSELATRVRELEQENEALQAVVIKMATRVEPKKELLGKSKGEVFRLGKGPKKPVEKNGFVAGSGAGVARSHNHYRGNYGPNS